MSEFDFTWEGNDFTSFSLSKGIYIFFFFPLEKTEKARDDTIK